MQFIMCVFFDSIKNHKFEKNSTENAIRMSETNRALHAAASKHTWHPDIYKLASGHKESESWHNSMLFSRTQAAPHHKCPRTPPPDLN